MMGTRRAGAAALPLGRTTAVATALLLVVAFLGVLPVGSAAPAAAPPTASPRASVAEPSVLAITQSPSRILEQDNMTVAVELTDTSAVKLVWFTFCQLSSALCYLPVVVMTAEGNGWYTGSTYAMSAYSGMNVSIRAGYNITVQLQNDSNFTEPHLPNAFPGLTVAVSISGEYLYQMQVSPNVYDLQGTIDYAGTSTPIDGANVSLDPGHLSTTTSASGGYEFDNLTNGSYTLNISKGDYRATNVSVAIDGGNVVKDLSVSNSTVVGVGSPGPTTANPSFFATTTGHAVLAGAVVVIVVVAVIVLLLRRRPPGAASPAPAAVPSPTPSEPSPPTP